MKTYLKGLLTVVLIVTCYEDHSAQIQDFVEFSNSQVYSIESDDRDSEGEIQMIKYSNDLLQIDLLKYTYTNKWSFNFYLWFDENVTAESQQFTYYDVFNYNVNLFYSFKNFQLFLQVVNLFKINNSEFAIEPSLENEIGSIINFEHVPIQQIGVGVLYTF